MSYTDDIEFNFDDNDDDVKFNVGLEAIHRYLAEVDFDAIHRDLAEVDFDAIHRDLKSTIEEYGAKRKKPLTD